MNTYLISFFILSLITVSSPGPAILFTVQNTLNHKLSETFRGILGVATGILFIATLATILLVFAANVMDFAFLITSVIGSLYFFYLSFSSLQKIAKNDLKNESRHNSFLSGILISLLNPKALAFFIFIFPLYLDTKAINYQRPILLSLIFSTNVIIVHSLYVCTFRHLAKSIDLQKFTQTFNKVSALLFFIFGILLIKQTLDNTSNLFT
ncbi:LysE family translocator [Aliikangiella maris]|uniref:LysE family translocator n=2 Tax=Aliikangiella maris TaxID=3162458 RepID=A0ABV3MP76_9GAMM